MPDRLGFHPPLPPALPAAPGVVIDVTVLEQVAFVLSLLHCFLFLLLHTKSAAVCRICFTFTFDGIQILPRGWYTPMHFLSLPCSANRRPTVERLPIQSESLLQGAKAKAEDPPSPRPPGRDIVAEARAAAAAGDEEEGLEGAAARAAGRAAFLGLAAASTGYSSLGGVEEHVGPAFSCLRYTQQDYAWFVLLFLYAHANLY